MNKEASDAVTLDVTRGVGNYHCRRYCLAVLTQLVVFPMFGLNVSLGENLGIGTVFTIVSLVRSFAMRRAFNALVARSAGT